MADPPTPPHTPASLSKGTSNVNQGNVDNRDITNNGGVVAGNVNGFNTIIGTLNLTVNWGSELTSHIETFTTRVATAAERLRDIETKIRATSQLLGSIRELVIARAAKENIKLDRDFQFQGGDGTAIGSGIPLNEGATGGNEAGEGTREVVQPGQASGGSSNGPEPNILNKACFRDLVNACKRAADRFEHINTKIQEAFNSIEPMRRGQHKVQLSHDDRMKFFLTERDIDNMERYVDIYRLEVHIALTAFEATMGGNRSEAIQLAILEKFKEIKKIGEDLLNRGRGPPETTRGPNEPGPHYRDPRFEPYPHQRPYQYRRPFVFPDLSRLTSLYLGWTFTKGRPPYVHINTTSTQPSWRWAVCSQMALSTEELFLKVLAQTTTRSKLRRSIQDDCKDLLKTSVQRMLVDTLLREQNENLSMQHPALELKLAGLSCKTRRIGFFSHETKSIDVILKTEWAPGLPPHDPMPPGGGGGPPPPPGFDSYGPGRPLGGGGGGPGYPPGGGDGGTFYQHGPARTSHGPHHSPGGPSNFPSHTRPSSSKTHPPPGVHHAPPQTPSKSAPEIVSRDRMYVVRKKAKGKPTASDSESSRRVFIRDKRGNFTIHIEHRRPTSSHADHIDGPSTSAQADHVAPPSPLSRPYESFHDSNVRKEYIPGVFQTHAHTHPPQPAAETVYSSSSSSSYSSDNEHHEYYRMPPQPPATSLQVPARDMTREQEKRIIAEIFAEWEDGVHVEPTTRPNIITQDPEHKMKEYKVGESSAIVPHIGPTRRMMMEVEHEAQRQEKIEEKIRESHRLGKPSYLHTREPHPKHTHSRSYERSSHRRRPEVKISLDGGADPYAEFEMDRRFANDERYHRTFAGPEFDVPGPSRMYYAPARPEIPPRERARYVHIDGVEPRVSVHVPPRGQREYDSLLYRAPSDLVVEDSESVRVMPSRMMERERERSRVVLESEPERPSRERGRRRVERERSRVRLESESGWSGRERGGRRRVERRSPTGKLDDSEEERDLASTYSG